MALSNTTLASLYHSREQDLKKEIGGFDKAYLQTVDLSALAILLGKKYAVKLIETCGECQITNRITPGIEATGNAAEQGETVTIIARFPVVDDPEYIQLIELMRMRVYSPAKKFKYFKGVIEMEATVDPSQKEVTTEHLKSDLEKRNRVLRGENEIFLRRIPSLLLAARNNAGSAQRTIR